MFITNFFKARDVGKKKGIGVHNSISNSLNRIKYRFCNGEFCVTPTGDIVSCHRVSSEKEKTFGIFCYGNITDEIHIDNDKLEKVLKVANAKIKDCENCFAKWHCAGACVMERSCFSEQQQLLKCNFNRKILTQMLKEKVFS
jgi:radical SAM protein with 4Fe4S-binding SPASM domain